MAAAVRSWHRPGEAGAPKAYTSAGRRTTSRTTQSGAASARDGGRVFPPQQDPEECLPRPDVGVPRAGHAREDLGDVIEVVDRPGRQQLAQGCLAERRVEALPVEVRVGHELAEQREVLGPQPGEALDQLVERLVVVAP